jgi:N6-L-threonylcarbamoyladenine synthase
LKYLLSIESTCDETAAAVLSRNGEVFSSIIASQEQLHQRFSGVVPEIAARAHLERMLPVIDEALQRANITHTDLVAIAVATEGFELGLADSFGYSASCARSYLCLSVDVERAHLSMCGICR